MRASPLSQDTPATKRELSILVMAATTYDKDKGTLYNLGTNDRSCLATMVPVRCVFLQTR